MCHRDDCGRLRAVHSNARRLPCLRESWWHRERWQWHALADSARRVDFAGWVRPYLAYLEGFDCFATFCLLKSHAAGRPAVARALAEGSAQFALAKSRMDSVRLPAVTSRGSWMQQPGILRTSEKCSKK